MQFYSVLVAVDRVQCNELKLHLASMTGAVLVSLYEARKKAACVHSRAFVMPRCRQTYTYNSMWLSLECTGRDMDRCTDTI